MATKTARKRAAGLDRAGERRRHERYRLTLHGKGVYLTIPARWSGKTHRFEVTSADVSLGGMMVHFDKPVNTGDTLRLAFPVSAFRTARFDAIVRWVKHDPQGQFGPITVGVAFVKELSQRNIDALLRTADRRGGAGVTVSTRQVNLPFNRAVEIAVRSLKIRLARSLVTSLVVLLATGFYAYMLSADAVQVALRSGELLHGTDAVQREWVAFVSFLVAGVGITNTLYMSVAERYREIGTMKCLGALDRFVVELFLLEAVALGVVGSGLGALGGVAFALAEGLLAAKEVEHAVLPWALLGLNVLKGLGVGLALTILGSLYPAFRAARMAPAEAMRTEV